MRTQFAWGVWWNAFIQVIKCIGLKDASQFSGHNPPLVH